MGKKTMSGKTTSTGILPVLVVVVSLALAGCGGGGGDETSATSVASSPSTTSKQETHEKSSSAQAGPSDSKSSQAQKGPKANEGHQPGGSAEQGAQIASPKGPREPEPTPKQVEEATLASMELSSPVLRPGPESVSTLPAPYTCDGKDTWPELKWSGVPTGTKELALLVLNIEPVNEALFFDWAITGLDPKLEGLQSGQLPKGAIVGRNSFGKIGYSICPPSHETIIFALYALPKQLPAQKGFDPMALRKQILESSGNSGLLAVSYG
jgi:phosphatidylethanolamine-binding protein (PEBP) family uncharacterized protein